MTKLRSLYLHFPFCKHLCNYCDFYKNKIQLNHKFDDYHTYLEKSFSHHKELIDKYGVSWGDLETIYIGGGTPSLWGLSGAHFFESFLHKNDLKLNDKREFTLEVNPGGWNFEALNKWEEVGVNRYSVGLQSLNPKFIKLLDRVHNIDDSYKALDFFFNKGINYSIDFMLGLPYSKENKREVIKELEEVLKFGPKHISLYILTTNNRYIHSQNIPEDDWIQKEFLEVSEFLTEKGFNHYEVSNFAKPGYESQHNFKYWDSESVAALGPSATGFLRFKNEGIRYKWKVNSAEYVLENLDREALDLEELYLKLRTHRGVDYQNSPFSIPSELVLKWQENGLVVDHDGVIRATAKGYLIMDSLMDDIFGESKILKNQSVTK